MLHKVGHMTENGAANASVERRVSKKKGLKIKKFVELTEDLFGEYSETNNQS